MCTISRMVVFDSVGLCGWAELGPWRAEVEPTSNCELVVQRRTEMANSDLGWPLSRNDPQSKTVGCSRDCSWLLRTCKSTNCGSGTLVSLMRTLMPLAMVVLLLASGAAGGAHSKVRVLPPTLPPWQPTYNLAMSSLTMQFVMQQQLLDHIRSGAQ